MINWHRLFGIFLTDYFTDTPYTVELEKDLSLQQQFLDVVILHKGEGEFQGVLPDGLDNLNTHNLLSYKSMRESFDAWAVQELIGHYVNYRKQLGGKSLVAETEFSLYAVSTRFPQGLKKQVGFTLIKQGVYELNVSVKIRLIVLSQIEKAAHNAVWHLFSNVLDSIDYGKKFYHVKANPSSAVNLLYEYYQLEGLDMPYTMEEFQKEVAQNHLHFLSPKERLKGISEEERLEGIPDEKKLEGISIDKRLEGISPEERVNGLSKQELMEVLEKLNIKVQH